MDRFNRTYVTLYERAPGELGGDTTLRASVKADGSVELVSATGSRGTAWLARKFSPNHPDIKGCLQARQDEAAPTPPRAWEVAGWWRWTRGGTRSLYLCLTATAPRRETRQ